MTIPSTSVLPSLSPAAPHAQGPLARLARWLVAADRRHRERRHAATLDDRLLRDVGLTRGDLERTMRGSAFRPR